MPSPAVTLKLKRFRHRFGPAAPKVTVRTHFGWPWYAGGVAILVLIVATVVWWLAQRDEVVALQTELKALRQQNLDMGTELEGLRARAGTEQSAVHVERTAQQQLLARMKLLEQENAALKEDIALFERLVPADGAESAVRIERLGVLSAAEPGRFRFRLLIGYQPSKQEREFKGMLQLSIVAMLGGKEIRLKLPAGDENASDFQIETRHFLRKEGSFVLPVGAKVKSIEARLMQGGVVKASQTAQF